MVLCLIGFRVTTSDLFFLNSHFGPKKHKYHRGEGEVIKSCIFSPTVSPEIFIFLFFIFLKILFKGRTTKFLDFRTLVNQM